MSRFSSMSFFSGDPDTRGAIVEALNHICATDDQVDSLSRHMQSLYNEWPGVYELRACACAMFAPADGVNCDSIRFPEGVPTPKELRHPEILAIPAAARRLDLPIPQQITAAKQKLIAGPVSQDPNLASPDAEIASTKGIERPRRLRTVSEIEAELYKKHPVTRKPEIYDLENEALK